MSGLSRPSTAVAQTPSIHIGYAAITWQGDDARAISEIASTGYHAIQLRNTASNRWGRNPGELRDLLARSTLTFAVMGSSNVRIDPSVERQELDAHLRNATFARAAGGQVLQLVDEKPGDRSLVSADYTRLGKLLTEIGRRTADIGIPIAYHHRMAGIGETPMEIDAVLDAADPRYVGLVLDIAHFQQAGGDPVAAIHRYGDRIRVVHLKDVRAATKPPGYQWVELGRGRVDVKGCVAALRETNFKGWAIVELDSIPDPGGSEKASALANRKYIEAQLALEL